MLVDGTLVTETPPPLALGNASHQVLYQGLQEGFRYVDVCLKSTCGKTATDGALKREQTDVGLGGGLEDVGLEPETQERRRVAEEKLRKENRKKF